MDRKLAELMKEATKVTVSRVNFYDNLFNGKKDTSKRLVTTQDGNKLVPRKSGIGTLGRASKSMVNVIFEPTSHEKLSPQDSALHPIDKSDQILSV